MDLHELAIQKKLIEKIKKEFTLDDPEIEAIRKEHELTKKDFNRIKRHCIERITKGYSYRDAWSIDFWFRPVMSGLLTELAKHLHGFSSNAEEMHKQCEKFYPEIKKRPGAEPKKKKENIDDYRFRLFKSDIETIAYLLREADEFTSSVKNKKKHVFRHHYEEILAANGKDKMYRQVDDLTKEEEEINRIWFEEERRVERYRADCMHTAMQMLDVYMCALWD